MWNVKEMFFFVDRSKDTVANYKPEPMFDSFLY